MWNNLREVVAPSPHLITIMTYLLCSHYGRRIRIKHLWRGHLRRNPILLNLILPLHRRPQVKFWSVNVIQPILIDQLNMIICGFGAPHIRIVIYLTELVGQWAFNQLLFCWWILSKLGLWSYFHCLFLAVFGALGGLLVVFGWELSTPRFQIRGLSQVIRHLLRVGQLLQVTVGNYPCQHIVIGLLLVVVVVFLVLLANDDDLRVVLSSLLNFMISGKTRSVVCMLV